MTYIFEGVDGYGDTYLIFEKECLPFEHGRIGPELAKNHDTQVTVKNNNGIIVGRYNPPEHK